ncbi:MAG: mitochondrial carrier domain-containing protein [Benniella sp.]|nr:MAG: mitochondrial carrier domain-containing protein [Benniella sp.]
MSFEAKGYLKGVLVAYLGVAVSRFSVAPLERIKLILQTQNELVRIGQFSGSYSGFFDCFSQVVAQEGPLSLWRGSSISYLRYFPQQFSYFAMNRLRRKLYTHRMGQSNGLLTLTLGSLAAGGLGGALWLLLLAPFDVIRTRLACDLLHASSGFTHRRFAGAWDVVRHIWKVDGIFGFFSGYMASVGALLLYRMLYFSLYDLAIPYLPREFYPMMGQHVLRFGVTVAAGWLSYPFDTLHRRIIIAAAAAEDATKPSFKYHSTFHALVQIVQNEGITALFQGSLTNIVRTVAFSIVLVGFDHIVRSL